jgi:hypothetical protein
MPVNSTDWYKGIILQLNLVKDKPVQFELHPIKQSEKDFELTLLENTQKEKVLSEIYAYSEIICNKTELEKKWEQLIDSKKRDINIFSPLNFVPGRYVQAVLRRLGFNKILMRKQGLKQILNHIRCEAHRDITFSLLNNTLHKK